MSFFSVKNWFWGSQTLLFSLCVHVNLFLSCIAPRKEGRKGVVNSPVFVCRWVDRWRKKKSSGGHCTQNPFWSIVRFFSGGVLKGSVVVVVGTNKITRKQEIGERRKKGGREGGSFCQSFFLLRVIFAVAPSPFVVVFFCQRCVPW